MSNILFDMTCDVTGDIEVKFLNFTWNISSRPLHCRLNTPLTSIGHRDRRGAATPPPPTSEGRGRTRPSRVRGRGLKDAVKVVKELHSQQEAFQAMRAAHQTPCSSAVVLSAAVAAEPRPGYEATSGTASDHVHEPEQRVLGMENAMHAPSASGANEGYRREGITLEQIAPG